MIICPSCNSQAFEGTFFCADCGMALIDVPRRPSSGGRRGHQEAGPIEEGSEHESLDARATLGLRVMTAEKVISLHGRRNFTLGQAVPGQAVVPDVDLSAYDAAAHGVSRIHAELRMEGSQVVALDLDSSNGTQVNGLYLEPREPIRLNHGDILQLGTLQLKVLIAQDA